VFGPYVVEAAIGSGVAGIVYRARHDTTGVCVAIKTVRLRSPEVLASFRREVHVLANLRHPGIVRILDHGVASGTPWYAMELVQGRTLSHSIGRAKSKSRAMDTAPGVASSKRDTALARPPDSALGASTKKSAGTPLAMGELLALFRSICRALAFLHAQGIVHRDLKPDNILIRPDGSPVLVDFGVVARFGGAAGREVLDAADPGRGTLAYMAPEQRLGRFVDARADLFSLGCILYECVTGVLPFGLTGPYALSIGPPNPPRARAPGLAPALDALIMRLLARDVGDRVGYADDVEAALGRVEGPGAPLHPVRRTAHLYRPDFAGRRDVLLQLERVLDAAMDGRGVKVIVTGESGVGKTRLIMELVARAAGRGMAVVAGDCPPVGMEDRHGVALNAPLRPLRGFLLAVADECRVGGPAVTERILAGRARVLAPYEPAFRDLPGVSDWPELEALPPEAARARVLACLKELVLDYSRERPLLFVLDDLQWADDLSLEFLASLTSAECSSAPIAIVGACRVEGMSERLQAWTTEPGSEHAHLERFDRETAEQMVAGMLALRAAPPELVDFVHRGSGGNAFFIAEYLRAAIGEGLLDRDDGGRWTLRTAGAGGGAQEEVALPTTLTALIGRRLDGLDPVALDPMYAAAVLDRGFDVDLVARTANVEVVTVLDAYAILRQRQVLEEDGAGITRFVHDGLREVVYARVGREAAAALHRRAAAAIEERYAGPDRDAQLGAIGYHHAKAGAADRAAEYFERAGDCSRRNYANRDALRFYRLALEQVNGEEAHRENRDHARCRLREVIGDLLLLASEIEAARSAFATALDDTPRMESIARARRRRKLARTWERQHRHGDALSAYATAEEELGEPREEPDVAGDYWHERVQIQVDKAWDLYWLGRVDELVALVERVRPMVEQYGLGAQRAQFFQALAHMAVRRDRYRIAEDTMDYARASFEAAEETGDIRELAVARFFLAFPLMLQGLEKEAEPLFVDAIAGAERAGDATLHTRALSYYAVLHRRLGRVAEAHAAADRARAMAEKGTMLDYVGASQANLCWVAWCQARGPAVESHASEALSAWGKLLPSYVYPFQWLARMPLAAHLAMSGRMDEALKQWGSLLDPPQLLLPDLLGEAIGQMRAARDAGSRASAEVTLGVQRIIQLSQQFRYL
jgi:serine/threonine protein kinase/tetratricopeptide (TPR) repeat protein